MTQSRTKKGCSEEYTSPHSFLEQAVDATLQRVPGAQTQRSLDHNGILVGEVTSTDEQETTGQVLVSWDADRNDSHRVGFVRGLELCVGDSVLLIKPNNRSTWLVTQIVESPKTIAAKTELQMDTRGEPAEATVDGKRVEITGRDEIVFKCGKSSITLHRNGRVLIRGSYVETKSRGTNRIKGGSVLIN